MPKSIDGEACSELFMVCSCASIIFNSIDSFV